MMKNENWKKYLIGAVVIYVVYSVYKGVQAAGNAVSSIAEMEALSKASKVSMERIAVCKDVAGKCETAIWNSHNMFVYLPWKDTRMDEDEDAVIQNLNRLNTAEESALTSQFYAQVASGHSLYADVKKYLSASEQAQIKITVINSIL